MATVKGASHADLEIGNATCPTVTTSTGPGGIVVTDVTPPNPLSTATAATTAAATAPTIEMLIGKY